MAFGFAVKQVIDIGRNLSLGIGESCEVTFIIVAVASDKVANCLPLHMPGFAIQFIVGVLDHVATCIGAFSEVAVFIVLVAGRETRPPWVVNGRDHPLQLVIVKGAAVAFGVDDGRQVAHLVVAFLGQLSGPLSGGWAVLPIIAVAGYDTFLVDFADKVAIAVIGHPPDSRVGKGHLFLLVALVVCVFGAVAVGVNVGGQVVGIVVFHVDKPQASPFLLRWPIQVVVAGFARNSPFILGGEEIACFVVDRLVSLVEWIGYFGDSPELVVFGFSSCVSTVGNAIHLAGFVIVAAAELALGVGDLDRQVQGVEFAGGDIAVAVFDFERVADFVIEYDAVAAFFRLPLRLGGDGLSILGIVGNAGNAGVGVGDGFVVAVQIVCVFGLDAFPVDTAKHQASRVAGPAADVAVGVDGFDLVPFTVQFRGCGEVLGIDGLPRAVPLIVFVRCDVPQRIGDAGAVAGGIVTIAGFDVATVMAVHIRY